MNKIGRTPSTPLLYQQEKKSNGLIFDKIETCLSCLGCIFSTHQEKSKKITAKDFKFISHEEHEIITEWFLDTYVNNNNIQELNKEIEKKDHTVKLGEFQLISADQIKWGSIIYQIIDGGMLAKKLNIKEINSETLPDLLSFAAKDNKNYLLGGLSNYDEKEVQVIYSFMTKCYEKGISFSLRLSEESDVNNLMSEFARKKNYNLACFKIGNSNIAFCRII